MAHLILQYADGRRTNVSLTKPEVVIGRDASCDVPLDDNITSRRHARLYFDRGGQYWIQDLRSKNGTLVNEQVISTSVRLRDKDRIGIGTCVLTLHSDAVPTETPPNSVILSDAEGDTSQGQTSAWGTEQRLDIPQMRLEKLYELNGRLTGLFDRDELLSEVLEICVELLRFERAGIALWSGGTSHPEWVKLKNTRGSADSEFRISRSVVDRALREGQRILINDTAAAEVDPTMSMISNNIRSAMCVPIQYHQKVQGAIYGDRVTSTGRYQKQDADFFAALGQLAAMGLVNCKLVDEIRMRQKVELDLQTAREIQSALCPAEPLEGPGFSLDALNHPGRSVSGDYFDYFARPDGLITVVIADVSGKGSPAALLMANLQAAVHVTLSHETDLAKAAGLLNRLICRNVSSGRFITAIFGLFDPQKRTVTYVNAGHHAPFLLRSSGMEAVTVEPALPLGIDPEYPFEVDVISLSPGPVTLFLYTDGVPDAENEQGEAFGDKRLREALSANLTEVPRELVTRIRRTIKQFCRDTPQTDDITMLALRVE